MKNFENTLKKASEQYIRKEYAESVCCPCSAETAEKIENILTDPSPERKNIKYRPLTKCLAAALLALFLLSSAVCAAVPEIRERFTDLLSGADTTDSVWYEKLQTVCEYFDTAEAEASPEAADILGQAIRYFEAAEREEQP